MRNIVLSGLAVLAVTGCAEGVNLGPGAGSNGGAVTQSLAFAGGDVIVAAPAGFCIDPRSVRESGSGGFVLIAGCDALTEGAASGPSRPALMSVSISPPLSAEAPTSAELVTATGALDPVEARDEDGLALVRLQAGGEERVPNGLPGHWRGAMQLGKRVLLLAAYGPEGSGVDTARGGDLVRGLARAIRRQTSAAQARGSSAGSGDDTGS